MNKKKTKVMFNNQLAGQQNMGVKEYIYMGQSISANPSQDKEIKRRTGVGWTAFGKHGDIVNSNLPLSLLPCDTTVAFSKLEINE